TRPHYRPSTYRAPDRTQWSQMSQAVAYAANCRGARTFQFASLIASPSEIEGLQSPLPPRLIDLRLALSNHGLGQHNKRRLIPLVGPVLVVGIHRPDERIRITPDD